MEQVTERNIYDFIARGGEMGERIRNFDWESTPLGRRESWSESLRSMVNIMLANRLPMLIWWGNEYIQLYNDAYIPVPGLKHPKKSLGVPGYECWSEIWGVLKPLVDMPFNGGPPTWMDDILLIVHRNGFDEETHFFIAYSPIPDETIDSGIGGVLATVNEITEQVLSNRTIETLRQLSAKSAGAQTENEVYEKVCLALRRNDKDFTFACLYKVSQDEKFGQLVSSTENERVSYGLPLNFKIDPNDPDPAISNISKAIVENSTLLSDAPEGDLPGGAWDSAPHQIIFVPVKHSNKKFAHAILYAGLNPYRRFDDSYRNLMQLVADQIAQAVNNAIAYEEERKRADALAEIDKAKTRFFANISHEFRTPLTLILGNIEEVLNDGQTVAANNKRLELAHRNSMRLLRLVNSLLDFSRIESGRQQSRFMLTDMAALTKNLASNFRSLIERAGLEFEVDAEAGIKPVYVDRSMWEKIVFNLLSNAYKYTLEGKITVNLCADHGGMRLTVTDSGTGIPENELPHMFDRFHRVANSGGRTFEGSGIGLSLTKELVALHGGTIEVESVEGGGSTFDVIIPYGKEHLPASQLVEDSQETAEFDSTEIYLEENGRTGEWEVDSANGMSGNTENPLVLIVDDNADMREYVRSVVAREFRTLTAANGSEALDKINDHSPAIIVSDIMMPVMDGIQLLKELKRNPQTQGIPVILLTARAGEESRIEGYDIGADDYLVKPFSTKEILSRIRAQLKIKRTQEFALKNLFYVFNEVPFSIAVLKGEDLVVEYANKYTLDIWQKSKEEVFGKPMFEIKPETRDAAKPIHEEVYRTGKRFSNYEIPVPVLRDGTTKMCYFNSTLDPMFNEEGKIIGQLATSSEVTEQVYARKKIEENEKELRHLNQQLGKELHATQELQNLGSQLIYKETGEQDVYDLLLGTATYLMGSDFASLQCYDPETESLRLLAHKNFHAASVSAWQKIKADSESVCGLALRHNSRILVPDVENEGLPQEQFDLYRLSGIRAVQSTPLISRSGGLVGMINSHWKNPKTFAEDDFRLFDLLARQAADLIERNESERKLKEGEEQLRNSNEQLELLMQQLEKIVTERTAELLKANRELESFTYIASHDLQEPLRKIISFIQLIEAKEEDANSFDKYFEKISAAARRMKALIESVLAYSYISKSELSVEIVDLNKVLSNVISDFEILINEKKATITFSKLPVIKGSPPQMHQLFSNIIGNSLKFTKRQPEIKITSARVMGGKLPGKGAIHEDQAYVQLVFADNGIGFEPQFAEKIFVPFQRLHNRNEYGGTGIGLSIVQRIVERHSGEISVESKAGEGTVFSIWLPVA